MYIKVGSQNDALNLSNLLKDGEWMVLYYAEWCGHCNTMKPEWKKVVDKMNTTNKNSQINVAEIESAHIDELVQKPKIDGFPTIKMYNNGSEVAKFEDERVADKIEKFALDNSNSIKSIKIKQPRNKKIINKAKTMKIKPDSMPMPTEIPTKMPTEMPTEMHTEMPTEVPTEMPSEQTIDLLKNNSIIDDKPNEIIDMNTDCSKNVIPKICKSTGNCTFDYNIKKCIEKPIIPKHKSILKTHKKNSHQKHTHINKKTTIKSTKSNTKSKPYSKKPYSKKPHSKPHSKSHSKPHFKPYEKQKGNRNRNRNRNRNSIRKTTKSVFTKLIDSFQRIGKEAETDAQLLTEAKHLL